MSAFSRSRLLLVLPLLAVVVALAGCGQKGPLYLPAPEADTAPVKEADEPAEEQLDQTPSQGSW